MSRVLLLLTIVFLGACDVYPEDPRRTLEQVQSRHVLRVGVIEHRPWAYRNGDAAAGIEAEAVAAFARRLQVAPRWTFLSEAEAADSLKQHDLDLVIGGLTEASPRKDEIGFTRPYCETADSKKGRHVLAVPRGENRFLSAVEVFLDSQGESLRSACQKEQGRGPNSPL